MRSDFVVYAHYKQDNNELFYIGEGTVKRAYSKHSRSKYWKNTVKKHNGFITKILYENLTKEMAEYIETNLIKFYKEIGYHIVNFCIGPAFKNHWLLNSPKERHPMFGKKMPEQSKRIIEWNKLHSGVKSPTYGLKRPDLTERNKLGLNCKKIICIETNEVFDSIKKASEKYGRISQKALKFGNKSRGFHWEYFTFASNVD